jgi:uncharacterized protein
MHKAANPFRFGSVVRGESFTDREREAAELRRDLDAGQDVVLLAPRRFGKTSLAERVIDQARADGHRIGYVDLDRVASKEQLADALAATTYAEIDTGAGGLAERARAFAERLRIRPRVAVEPEGVSFTFEPAVAATDIDETIDELLGLAGPVRAQRGTPVALVFDEFQEITRLDEHYPRRWRSVFQRQPDVAHVYLGSRRHALARLFTEENEPFYRAAKVGELGPIPVEDFAPFLHERFAATGKALSPDASGAVLDLTAGAPYSTQALAYFVWDETPPGGTADLAVYQRGLDRTLDAETSHYSTVWEALSGPQRTLLQALAAESPARPLQDTYRRRYRLGSTSRVQRAADALQTRALVRSEGRGVLAIADPLLARWLQRSS